MVTLIIHEVCCYLSGQFLRFAILLLLLISLLLYFTFVLKGCGEIVFFLEENH